MHILTRRALHYITLTLWATLGLAACGDGILDFDPTDVGDVQVDIGGDLLAGTDATKVDQLSGTDGTATTDAGPDVDTTAQTDATVSTDGNATTDATDATSTDIVEPDTAVGTDVLATTDTAATTDIAAGTDAAASDADEPDTQLPDDVTASDAGGDAASTDQDAADQETADQDSTDSDVQEPINLPPEATALVTLALAEDATPGALAGTIGASDPNVGQVLSFAVLGGDGATKFSVDAATGAVSLADGATLDHEVEPAYTLLVRISDDGVPSLAVDVTVVVEITDVNEAPSAPFLLAPLSLAEDATAGTVAGIVFAFDVDASSQLGWSIVGGSGAGLFSIDPLSGSVGLASDSTLNFEEATSYTLLIQVTDEGGLSTTSLVSLDVLDVNEAPLAGDVTLSVAEHAPAGTVVGTFAATDEDAGQTLSYVVLGGDNSGLFVVDGAALTLARSPTQSDVGEVKLLVAVSDNANPQATTLFQVDVVVTDVNDPPQGEVIGMALAEDATTGALAATLTLFDPDQASGHLFELQPAEASAMFTVDPLTGEVLLTGQLDYETTSYWLLSLLVTDADGGSVTLPFTVTITNVNEAPTLIGSTFQLAENSAAGAEVGTASGGDVDAGDSLTYSIIGGTGSSLFSISSGGAIAVATGAAFDFEGTQSYSLQVQAQDAGGLTAAATFTVELTNVNEAPTLSGSTFQLAENSAEGAAVGTASGSDVDLGDSLTYSITGGTGSSLFSISSGGAITVATGAVLNFEGTKSYTLQVQAQDAGSLTAAATFTVELTNVNEAPTLTGTTFQLAENSAAGAAVGTASGSDVDAGDSLSYSITGGTGSSLFSISSGGAITVAAGAVLNFEGTKSYTLQVQVQDAGSLTAAATFTVELTNVNEAPSLSGSTFQLAENSAEGAAVGTASGSDVDAGDSLTYSITGGTGSSLFSISSGGAITVATGAVLNFEGTKSYTLQVQVQDAGSLTAAATFTVELTNVNEAPSLSGSTFQLAENSTAGAAVGTASGSDVDAGDSLSYSITGGTGSSLFSIGSGGAITVAAGAVLNFEGTKSYTLQVQVQDAGSLTAAATFTVELTNVNEAPSLSGSTFQLAENSAEGTAVGTASGSDVDLGDSLTYSITGGTGSSLFSISSGGAITVATGAVLNYEGTKSYTLQVQAQDAGSLTAAATFTVELTNVNEAPSLSGSTFQLAENSAEGTAVGTASGSDVDAGDSLTYSITGGTGSSLFSISSGGAITVATGAVLNFEGTKSYTLQVQAQDAGSLTAAATFTVELTNVNEAPSLSGSTFQLAENSAEGTAVGTASGSDVDAGDSLTYSITGGTGSSLFSISSGGAITVAAGAVLNFEGTKSYTLQVQVQDAGSLTAAATFTVELTNVNEAPSLSGSTFQLAENSAEGTAVGTASGSDVDAGDSLTYSITGGTGSSLFSISSGGAITVATGAVLNFEGTKSYTLQVQAQDAGSLTAAATFTVELTDVNEAPVLADTTLSFSLSPQVGDVLGTLVGSDVDAGQSLTYAITDGNSAGYFAISTAGEVSIADASYSTSGTYVLTITVTDNGSPQLTDTATLTLESPGIPPVAAADTVSMGVGTDESTNALTNDDVGTPAATVVSFGGGSLGGNVDSNAAGTTPVGTSDFSAAVSASGAIKIVAATPGNYTLSYRTSNTGGSSTATITVKVCYTLASGEVKWIQPDGGTGVCVKNTDGSNRNYGLVAVNMASSGGYPVSVTGSNLVAPTATEALNAVASGSSASSPAAQFASTARTAAMTAKLVAQTEPISNPHGIPSGTPAVNDIWYLNANTTDACTSVNRKSGRVFLVTTKYIFVEDLENPLDEPNDTTDQAGFTDLASNDSSGSFYDVERYVYDGVTPSMGTPTDLDSNGGRVVLFFTRELNELSPPASSTVVSSRSHPRDLLPQSQCTGSNGGEVIYLMVPDPAGVVNSNVRTISFVRGNFPRDVAGELARLIVHGHRWYTAGLNTLEVPYVVEALVGIAEELTFFAASVGLAPRGNIVVTQLTTGPNASRRVAAFNTYANTAYGLWRSTLQNTTLNGLGDPAADRFVHRGTLQKLFRYLDDRVGATANASIAALASSTTTGDATMAAAFGADWKLLIRDFALVSDTDDSVVAFPATYSMTSWNNRSIYTALNGSYQLSGATLSNNIASTLRTLAANGGYLTFRFAVASGIIADLAITQPVTPLANSDIWYAIYGR